MDDSRTQAREGKEERTWRNGTRDLARSGSQTCFRTG